MTGSTFLFVSRVTSTPTNRNQPFSVGAAIHLRLFPLLGLVYTRPPDLHQRGGVGPSDGIREGCQVPDGEWTSLIEDPDRDQGDAGAHVLEGQVEALPGGDLDVTHLRVQLHDAVAYVHLVTEGQS